MKQGDVYWHSFRAPDKRRPVLIVTRNSAITFLTGITVVAITSTIRGVPSEVVLTPGQDGMVEECAVNAYNIQTVPKFQLDDLITQLSPERMREIRAAIEFALGFDALA
jgi:mRNA interferase MazF